MNELRRIVVVVACAAAVAVSTGAAHAAHASKNGQEWRVTALRYATIKEFPVHELVAGADTARRSDIAMMFWLLDGPPGRHVLVDAGFHSQKFIDAWHPAYYMSPAEVVRRFGVAPDSITDVIVSHIHWDHMNGIEVFPRATVWIQRAEYEHYVGPGGVPLDAQIDTVDAAQLARLDQAGRVRKVDGDARELMPGITVYTGGKHTYESQYVGVTTRKGTVVVASDNVYLYENLDKHVPIAATHDAKSNLAAQDRMKTIASSRKLIVPGHDPAVFQRFKQVGPGAVRIE